MSERLTEDDGVLPLMSLHEGDVVDAEDEALADRYEVSVGKLWVAYRLAESERDALSAKVEAMAELLTWFDNGGGLGHDVHAMIRKVLGKEGT